MSASLDPESKNAYGASAAPFFISAALTISHKVIKIFKIQLHFSKGQVFMYFWCKFHCFNFSGRSKTFELKRSGEKNAFETFEHRKSTSFHFFSYGQSFQ